MLNFEQTVSTKGILTFVLLYLFGLAISAQEVGEKEHYPNGNVQSEIIVKNGEKVKYKNYYPNGNLKSEFPIRNHHLNGKAYYYYEDGSLKREGNFSNGKPHGWHVLYKNGRKIKEVEFKHGTIVTEKEFHPNGQLKVEGSINKSGEVDGYIRSYYENGDLEFSGQAKNGRIVSGNYYNRDGSFSHKHSLNSESNYSFDTPPADRDWTTYGTNPLLDVDDYWYVEYKYDEISPMGLQLGFSVYDGYLGLYLGMKANDDNFRTANGRVKEDGEISFYNYSAIKLVMLVPLTRGITILMVGLHYPLIIG